MIQSTARFFRTNAAGLSLCLAFAMLWVPMGQYPFLLFHWMKLGTFMAPFLLLVAFAFQDKEGAWKTSQFVALAVLLAYIAHQFEEHWIDVLGNTFAFQSSVNALILSALNVEVGADAPPNILTREAIFVINTSLVWLVGALAIWRGAQTPVPVLAMIAIALVNGISHIASALATGAYNPGLVTSIFVFLPLGLYGYAILWRRQLTDGYHIVLSLLWSVAAHVIMVLGLIAANWWQLFPEIVYFAVLIVWSIVPTAWSWRDR